MTPASYSSIADIEPLTADWDGMSAGPVTRATADRAKRYLESVAEWIGKPSSVCASPAGAIVASWQSERGCTECEIGETGPAEWMEVDMDSRSVTHWEDEIK